MRDFRTIIYQQIGD